MLGVCGGPRTSSAIHTGVKFLFDQNISRRLVRSISDVFPGSSHVSQHDLSEADDSTVWDFARERQFTIVSKDEDFRQLSFLYGAPPKVIWVRLGNCTTDDIDGLLRRRADEIMDFLSSSDETFLAIS